MMTNTNQPYNRLLEGVFLIAIAAVLAAFPIVRFGLWPQTSLVFTTLHLSAALGGIIVCLKHRTTPQTITNYLLHPFVLLPLLLGSWFMATSFLQAVPILSWFGVPQQGEGALWYIDLGLLTLMGLDLKQRPTAFKRLALAATAIALLTGFFCYFGLLYKWRWLPYYFPDHTAFHLAFVAVLLMTALPSISLHLRSIIVAGIISAMLYMTDNITAQAIAILMLPLTGLCATLPLLRRNFSRIFLVLTILTPVLFAGLALWFGTLKGVDLPSWLPGYTLWSRYHLMEVAVSALRDNPTSWVTGLGWGNYGDQLLIHLPVNWLDLTSTSGQWEAVYFHHFHSHNSFLDMVLAGGLPALLLFAVFLFTLPLYSRPEHRKTAAVYSLFLVALHMFWFQMAISLPLFALANASLADPQARLRRGFFRWGFFRWPSRPRLARTLVIAASLASLAGSLIVFDTSRRIEGYHPAPLSEYGGTCPTDLLDYHRGGLHLARQLRSYTGYLNQLAQWQKDPQNHPLPSKARRAVENGESQPTLGPSDFGSLATYLCMIDTYEKTSSPTLTLLLARLLTYSDIALIFSQNPAAQSLIPSLDANWEAHLHTFLDIATHRTDQAAPYLLWRLGRGEETKAFTLARDLYQENPEDAVALWFTGLTLLADPVSTAEGLQRMNKALDNGIQRIIPIDERTIEDVRRAKG